MSKYNTCSVQIFSEKGNKVVGHVKGNTFHKTIKRTHILQKPLALASDVSSLMQAEAAGAEYFEAKVAEDGTIYRARIEQFWRDGFRFNRGWGDQIGLPLSAFTRQKHGQLKQLDLFDLESISIELGQIDDSRKKAILSAKHLARSGVVDV